MLLPVAQIWAETQPDQNQRNTYPECAFDWQPASLESVTARYEKIAKITLQRNTEFRSIPTRQDKQQKNKKRIFWRSFFFYYFTNSDFFKALYMSKPYQGYDIFNSNFKHFVENEIQYLEKVYKFDEDKMRKDYKNSINFFRTLYYKSYIHLCKNIKQRNESASEEQLPSLFSAPSETESINSSKSPTITSERGTMQDIFSCDGSEEGEWKERKEDDKTSHSCDSSEEEEWEELTEHDITFQKEKFYQKNLKAIYEELLQTLECCYTPKLGKTLKEIQRHLQEHQEGVIPIAEDPPLRYILSSCPDLEEEQSYRLAAGLMNLGVQLLPEYHHDLSSLPLTPGFIAAVEELAPSHLPIVTFCQKMKEEMEKAMNDKRLQHYTFLQNNYPTWRKLWLTPLLRWPPAQCFHFKELPSTHDTAKSFLIRSPLNKVFIRSCFPHWDPKKLEGLPFAIVLADKQTNGHGSRPDRKWEPTAGALYISVILSPNDFPTDAPTLLGQCASLAVYKTIQQIVAPYGVVGLKAPNDIYLALKSSPDQYRKVSGVLAEIVEVEKERGSPNKWAVVSCGANVDESPKNPDTISLWEVLPEEMKRKVNRDVVADLFLSHLFTILEYIKKGQYQKDMLRQEWESVVVSLRPCYGSTFV